MTDNAKRNEAEAPLLVDLLADHGERRVFAAGEELRRKGDHYTDMYLVLRGAVEVVLQPDAESDPILVGPGLPIGEIGFLKGCRATATATAREETEVLVLDDDALWKLEKEEPSFSVLLLRALARTTRRRVEDNASLEDDGELPTGPPVEVYLCRKDEQFEAAIRLRYQVYCKELGRSSPYADHELGIIRDSLDDFGHTFIATEDGEPVGTLRCNFADAGPLGTLEELYGMASSPHHPKKTMICTKLIVKKAKRGGPASMSMIAAMARYALKEGMSECYIDTIPDLVPLYRRLGFKPAGEEFFHYENGPSLPMMLDVTKRAARLAARLES